jgi:hypothetical protein
MFQADHHFPCAKGSEGNLPKWIPPVALTSIAMKGLERLVMAYINLHPPGYSRPNPIHIPRQQIHRWRNLNRTPHGPWTKGTPMWECCSLTTAQRSTLYTKHLPLQRDV